MGNNETVVLTDINDALSSADREAYEKPAALLIVGGDLNGAIFDLKEQETSIGRNPDNTIPLEFNGVSRYHCKVLAESEEEHILEDCGSKNGTFLNNQKVEQNTPLKKGDMIKLGNIAMKYLPKGDPERLTYDKLNYEANTDRHTGCYNKSYFNNSISMEVKKSKLTGCPLSLIIFDLDHFKKLNDEYGHDAGDFVLKEVAGLIRKNGVRDDDVFARYGGEEFVILLPKTNLKQSFEIAERFRREIEEFDFIYEDQKLAVTVSIGVADYRQGVNSGTDLFKRADQAVYKSKGNGRNQVSFFRE